MTDKISEQPSNVNKKWPGHPSIFFALLLGIPIALYQYFPNYSMLDLIAGICTLMLGALILSPITQRIRRKERFSFPFVSIFIVLLIGTPVCIYFGWEAVYYTLASFAGLSVFFSILLRISRKKD